MSIRIQTAPVAVSTTVGLPKAFTFVAISDVAGQYQPSTVIALTSDRVRMSLNGLTWSAWGASLDVGTVSEAGTTVYAEVRSIDANSDGYDDLDLDHDMSVTFTGLFSVPNNNIQVVGGVRATFATMLTAAGTISTNNPVTGTFEAYCSPYGTVISLTQASGSASTSLSVSGAVTTNNPAAGTANASLSASGAATGAASAVRYYITLNGFSTTQPETEDVEVGTVGTLGVFMTGANTNGGIFGEWISAYGDPNEGYKTSTGTDYTPITADHIAGVTGSTGAPSVKTLNTPLAWSASGAIYYDEETDETWYTLRIGANTWIEY